MLARACADICEGQHMDMSFEKRDDVDEYEYLEMVKKKTGVLYAAAAGIGAILGGGNAQQTKTLYNFGLNTGIAFQIQDDLIDLSNPFGKERERPCFRSPGRKADAYYDQGPGERY